MAGATKLDGAGMAKLKTLEEGLVLYGRIHALTEQFGLALKQNKPTMQYVTQIKRNLPTLASNLKNQFGMISDLIMAVNLASSRGASEQVKLRGLREGLAQIKQALEIAVTQTKTKHAVEE